MTIHYNNKTIELTKTEMKKASVYGSEAYKDLVNAQRDYPGFSVVEKKGTTRDNYKGLTIEFMKNYITKHGSDDKKAVFANMCGADEDGKELQASSVSYGKLRMWFLKEFPEFEEYNNKRNDILDKIREENAAKRELEKAAKRAAKAAA